MAKVRLIALNGSGGAFVSIAASQVTRRVEIIEDEAATAQGVQAKFPSDAFTQAFVFGASTEPIILGEVVPNQNGDGPILGLPGQNVPAAYAGGTTYNKGDEVLNNDANGVSRAWVCILNGTVGITPVTGANWNLAPNYRAADVLIQMRSNTATGTNVRVVEYS